MRQKLEILDEFDEKVLELKESGCSSAREFKVLSSDRTEELGKITVIEKGFDKKGLPNNARFALECNFKKNFFNYRFIINKKIIILVQIPIDLSVKTKATLLGALFYIVIFIEIALIKKLYILSVFFYKGYYVFRKKKQPCSYSDCFLNYIKKI